MVCWYVYIVIYNNMYNIKAHLVAQGGLFCGYPGCKLSRSSFARYFCSRFQSVSGHSSSGARTSASADDLPLLEGNGSRSAKAAYRQVGGKRLVYTELRTGPSHNCMHLNHHFVCLGHVCSPGRSVSWEEVTWGVINSGWASLLVVMRGYCGGSAS